MCPYYAALFKIKIFWILCNQFNCYSENLYTFFLTIIQQETVSFLIIIKTHLGLVGFRSGRFEEDLKKLTLNAGTLDTLSINCFANIVN